MAKLQKNLLFSFNLGHHEEQLKTRFCELSSFFWAAILFFDLLSIVTSHIEIKNIINATLQFFSKQVFWSWFGASLYLMNFVWQRIKILKCNYQKSGKKGRIIKVCFYRRAIFELVHDSSFKGTQYFIGTTYCF